MMGALPAAAIIDRYSVSGRLEVLAFQIFHRVLQVYRGLSLGGGCGRGGRLNLLNELEDFANRRELVGSALKLLCERVSLSGRLRPQIDECLIDGVFLCITAISSCPQSWHLRPTRCARRCGLKR